MRRLGNRNEEIGIRGLVALLLGGFKFLVTCVRPVYLLFMGLVKLVDNSASYARVVFATLALRISQSFIRSLYPSATQVFTRQFLVFNIAELVFIHIIHSPNKSYNKGD